MKIVRERKYFAYHPLNIFLFVISRYNDYAIGHVVLSKGTGGKSKYLTLKKTKAEKLMPFCL